MLNFAAYAVLKDGVIEVSLSGTLPNSCHSASVKDKYPGGGIMYVTDPGTAQVFVEELVKPDSRRCLLVLFPWFDHVSIPGSSHDQVTVFINGEKTLTVAVLKEEPTEYRVIALTASLQGGSVGCSVIPADAPYSAIYTSVYGPASKADCETWLNTHCVSP